MDEVPIPPLGITPRFLWDERRLAELDKAMLRYMYAGQEIPQEWHMERTELVNSLCAYYNRRKPSDGL